MFRNMQFRKYSILSSLLFVLFAQLSFAQFSPYHGIVFPYDNPNNIIFSAGGITHAAPDYTLNVQSNPVSPILVRSPKIFLSFSRRILKYKENNYSQDHYIPVKSPEWPNEYNSFPNRFSGVLPIKLFKKGTAIAISINKINSPENPVLTTNLSKDYINYQREGEVWIIAAGISSKLSDDVQVGLSLSKWLGGWEYGNNEERFYTKTTGKLLYYGNILNFGVIKNIKKFSLSFIYHTPTKLMHSENVLLKWGRTGRFGVEHDIQQHFNGAFKFGLAYHWNERFTLSTGYRYQAKFSIRDKIKVEADRKETIHTKEEYGRSHQISISTEYIARFVNYKFPVFIACWADYLPSTPEILPKYLGDYYINRMDDYLFGFQFLTVDESSNVSKNIAFGIQLPLSFLNLYLVGQYNQNSIHIFNNINSPWVSSFWWPSDSFDVKKSTFLFNIGVSCTFGKQK